MRVPIQTGRTPESAASVCLWEPNVSRLHREAGLPCYFMGHINVTNFTSYQYRGTTTLRYDDVQMASWTMGWRMAACVGQAGTQSIQMHRDTRQWGSVRVHRRGARSERVKIRHWLTNDNEAGHKMRGGGAVDEEKKGQRSNKRLAVGEPWPRGKTTTTTATTTTTTKTGTNVSFKVQGSHTEGRMW